MFNLLAFKQPLCIISSIVLGLLYAVYSPIEAFEIKYVEYFLMALLFLIFLSIDIEQLKKSSLNFKYTSTSILINFIITPILAYILGLVFFPYSIEIRIALIMLLVTPCTDWYLVFTKLAKGNLELNIALLPINLFLQVALLPLYLLIFLGNSANFSLSSIFFNIFIVLCIPFLFAMRMQYLIRKHKLKLTFLDNHSEDLQLLFLVLAVFTMFSSQGLVLLENFNTLITIFIPILLFFIIIYCIVKAFSKVLKFNTNDSIALCFTCLARNSPLALAIAISSFSQYPIIALCLVIAPLIELPVLSIVAGIFLRKK